MNKRIKRLEEDQKSLRATVLELIISVNKISDLLLIATTEIKKLRKGE